jgi:hypothetical protein
MADGCGNFLIVPFSPPPENVRDQGHEGKRTIISISSCKSGAGEDKGFRSPGNLQRFISAFSAIRNLFVPPQSKCSALSLYLHRLRAIAHWKAMTGTLA